MSLAQFISIQFLFHLMSLATGKSVGTCMAIMFGGMLIVMGLVFTFIIPDFDPIFDIISNIILYGGILLLIIGFAMVPGTKRETNKIRSIIEIAAVRKEVSISDISYETGLDLSLIHI